MSALVHTAVWHGQRPATTPDWVALDLLNGGGVAILIIQGEVGVGLRGGEGLNKFLGRGFGPWIKLYGKGIVEC